MIAIDEDALECDLAETYGIYDYRALPPERVALFSVGLRDNSRIKSIISGQSVPLDTMLIACAVDRLSLLVWSRSKDAEKGRNKPSMIVDALMHRGENTEKEFVTFNSPDSFEQALKQIQNGG